MIGWLKRRLLARRARKALDSVGRYGEARADLARFRSAGVSSPAPSPSYAVSHQVDPLGINQALVLSSIMDDGRSASAACSSSSSSSDYSSSSSSYDSSSSSSSYDSSSSCSSSSSSWD